MPLETAKKDGKYYLLAFILLFFGAICFVLYNNPNLFKEFFPKTLLQIIILIVSLVSIAIGEAMLIFKLIEERSIKDQKVHTKKSSEKVTEEIIGNLDKTFSVVGDCKREKLLEVLPPRWKPEADGRGCEKNSETFNRLWKYIVETLSKSCKDDNKNEIKLRMCSIAQTDIFHNDGKLTQRFSNLLTKGRLQLDDGVTKWFCGCNDPSKCKRRLIVQVIILDPSSDAAGVRTAAEGAEATNEVKKHIERTIQACKNLHNDMKENKLKAPNAKITLELSTVHHHPLTSFIHTPDWVEIEIIHWGRKIDDYKTENPPYECLGGRVPILIFSCDSPIHGFLKDQFDLQWKTKFSQEDKDLGWLGTENIFSEEEKEVWEEGH